MIYRPSHFKAYELVDRVTYASQGEGAMAIFRPEILIAIDHLRSMIGKPFTVNTWKDGGKFQWRGLRTENCKEGSPYSMHRYAAAFDFDVQGLAADEVRKYIRTIRRNIPELKNGITRMEIGISWVHIDCKATDSDGLVEFQP